MERLTNLADVLRAKGLTVEELPNWKTTSRSDDRSVYLSGRPTHFMHHHTASNILAHNSHDKCRREASALQLAEPNEPTSNTALCPHAVWFCICAGPSNTNGLGADTWHPVGDPLRVPTDSMNSYALANEMLNNGIGESYPVEMQQSLLIGTAALCIEYGIGVYENRAHFEWAPTRKIDPAGPSQWTKLSDPNLKWDMGKFRTDIQLEIIRQTVPGEVSMSNLVLVDCAPGWFLWDENQFAIGVPVPPNTDLVAMKNSFKTNFDIDFKVIGPAFLPLMQKLESLNIAS